MKDTNPEGTIFLTWVYSSRQLRNVRLLIDSLRSFGGALGDRPIWVFETNPQEAPCQSLESLGAQVLPLDVPGEVRHYDYADKVYACARAEELAPPAVQSLVWLTPECLIVKPPLLFDLAGSFDAAVRPVHIQNVGLLAEEPLDGFWKKVYETVGVPDIQTTVESFVDAKRLRAYYNSAAFAINPALGLMHRWFDVFQTLVCDRAFQAGPCQGDWHQVFLHQAVLTTLIGTHLDPQRVRSLPPEYVYPYNLHADVPPEWRARVLNDLVCVYHEGRSLDPQAMDDIQVHEPLRAWLSARAADAG